MHTGVRCPRPMRSCLENALPARARIARLFADRRHGRVVRRPSPPEITANKRVQVAESSTLR